MSALPPADRVVEVFTDLFKRQCVPAQALWEQEPEVVLLLLGLKAIRWINEHYIPETGPRVSVDKAVLELKKKMIAVYPSVRMNKRFLFQQKHIADRAMIVLHQLKEDPDITITASIERQGTWVVYVANATEVQLSLATRLIHDEGLGKAEKIDVETELAKLGIRSHTPP